MSLINIEHQVSTIINYCSNEYRFINHAIKNAFKASNQVIIPVCDHFFSAKPENRYLLNKTYEENPLAIFIEFTFINDWFEKFGPHFWPNIARWIGSQYVKNAENFVLFLDADEIIESDKFKKWLCNTNLDTVDSVKFLNYWYFRETKHQALQFEDTVVMTKKASLNPKAMFRKSERHGLLLGNHLRDAVSIEDQRPIIHHFSWVRTKQEILNKVTSWSHKLDRDWVRDVEEEFSRPFNGKDFVHGYDFKNVEPIIDIDLEPISSTNEASKTDRYSKRQLYPNVIYLSEKETLEIFNQIGWLTRLLIR